MVKQISHYMTENHFFIYDIHENVLYINIYFIVNL